MKVMILSHFIVHPKKVIQNGDFMVKHIDAYLDKYPIAKQKI